MPGEFWFRCRATPGCHGEIGFGAGCVNDLLHGWAAKCPECGKHNECRVYLPQAELIEAPE